MNSQLGARLKSMLLVDVDDQSSESSAFPSASVQDKNDAANAKKKILIEEVDDREIKRSNNVRKDLPAENVNPCLVTNEASSTLSPQTMQRIGVESMTNNTSNAPSSSLAEQMMTTAASAQASQKERQRNEQQNRAKKATFGMKKGFLMKKDKKKKKSSSTTKNVQVVGNSVCNVIEKSDQDNLIQDLSSKGHTSTTPNPLYIPEVQDALSSQLQSSQSKWASPSFLNSLAQHPTLSKGWNNPKYLAALHNMKTHPQETMEKLKNDEPEILHWLMEFLGVMGDHFVTLGAEEENTEENSGKENNTWRKTMAKTNAEPKMIREIGPLEEKAMRAHKARSNFDSQMLHQEKTTAEDDEVAKILSNEALRSTLLDPKMQQVMEELAHESGVGAGKLQYYLNHDTFGPKLRMLMKAGLLKMA